MHQDNPQSTPSKSLRLATVREELKIKLRQRFEYYSKKPICPVCGEEIENFGQVHEVIIPRHVVMSASDELKLWIHQPCNCVEVCSTKCHVEAEMGESEKRCIEMLVLAHGYTNLFQFVLLAGKLGLSSSAEREALLKIKWSICDLYDHD